MIVFENQGEIDPRLITTMGVNVKEGASPVGFFGTGLKYAIAAMLRLGEHIEIHSGMRVFKFSKEPEEIRGKSFDFIVMEEEAGDQTSSTRLGFTTELGKTWEPWMIYRELYCNCKDEGGEVYECSGWEVGMVSRQPLDYPPKPVPGLTRILVSGSKIESTHASRSEFLLLTKPLHEDENLAVHPGVSEFIFYRGIRAGKLGGKSLYTYNIKHPMKLTEDRTIDNTWTIPGIIADYTMTCEESNFIDRIIVAPDTVYERKLDFDRSWVNPSKEFVDRVSEGWKARRLAVNPSLIGTIVRHAPQVQVVTNLVLTPVQTEMLERAQNFLKILGYDLSDYPIRVITDLGGYEILAEAKLGTIWLTKRIFEQGTKQVAAAILEEYLHLRHGYRDCTREMQTMLLDKIISLGEDIQGKPL